MFGLSLLASLVVITLIWGRLAQHKVGAAAAVPTLWIVLGPLGQSITAAGVTGVAAQSVLPEPYAGGAAALALFFGLATWGFAVLWLAIAAAITIRTARAHLPFSLTWWSFTFPVGTLVTGTSGLAARTHLDVLGVAAVSGQLVGGVLLRLDVAGLVDLARVDGHRRSRGLQAAHARPAQRSLQAQAQRVAAAGHRGDVEHGGHDSRRHGVSLPGELQRVERDIELDPATFAGSQPHAPQIEAVGAGCHDRRQASGARARA